MCSGFHAQSTLLSCSVLEENLESHLNRCPLLKQEQSLSRQPFYQRGINAGRDEEEEKDEGNADPTVATFTSEMKRNAVYDMTVPKFSELIAKINSVHASMCNEIRDSYKIPEACSIWTNKEVDRKMPYQEKHVLQQASILGNLEEFGVLNKSSSSSNGTSESCESNKESDGGTGLSAVVEFGAGRGYLTQMIADCYGIRKVLLVERKSYKLKADRSLRQKESLILERLRIDNVEDLNLNDVESLRGVGYMAIGKHLCGPATDVTLRCCIQQQPDRDIAALRSQASCYLSGLAIATCCHHLCQWKSYINKRYILDLGFSKEDFHAISWFTSWAVDADHGSEFSIANCSSQLEITGKSVVCGGGGVGIVLFVITLMQVVLLSVELMVSLSMIVISRNEKKELWLDSKLWEVGDIVRNMEAIERAVLGYMCKDIIDAGRLMWVKARGLESELVKYVPVGISPENRLLLARNDRLMDVRLV
ncbi:hypothetical protein OROGR_019195 [Orobanche gracilis]